MIELPEQSESEPNMLHVMEGKKPRAIPTGNSGNEAILKELAKSLTRAMIRKQVELDNADIVLTRVLEEILRYNNGEYESNELNMHLISSCQDHTGIESRTCAAALALMYLALSKKQQRAEMSQDKEPATSKRRSKINFRLYGKLMTDRHEIKSARKLEQAFKYLYDNADHLMLAFFDARDGAEAMCLLQPTVAWNNFGNVESTVGWESRLSRGRGPCALTVTESRAIAKA